MLVRGMWRMGKDWDLLPEIQRLQRDMNNLFAAMPSAGNNEHPAVTIWSGENDYILAAELPGVDQANLDISVVGDMVTLSGRREFEPLKKGETWHRQERQGGHFSRTIQLPMQIDAEKVTAGYEKGILRITLPRAAADKPRKIAIKAD